MPHLRFHFVVSAEIRGQFCDQFLERVLGGHDQTRREAAEPCACSRPMPEFVERDAVVLVGAYERAQLGKLHMVVGLVVVRAVAAVPHIRARGLEERTHAH